MFENKIINIFDDDKFIDPAIKLIEGSFPNQSVYIVITKTDGGFKYVKSELAKQLVVKDKENLWALIESINSSYNKGVFFHSLNKTKIQIANNLRIDIVKVWFIWGFDLYNQWKILDKKTYANTTKSVLGEQTLKQWLKDKIIFNDFAFKLFLKSHQGELILPSFLKTLLENNFNTSYYKAIAKMDFVAPVLPNEYEVIEKMGLKAKYVPFTYGCIEDLLGINMNNNVLNAKNILLGNSANPNNNHIDIIKKLANIDLRTRKVYVPLNYGGSASYISKVIAIGEKSLGENFVPLKTFMPLDKYNQILLSCGTVTFNHIRQQGIGSLIIAGYLGAKIYLNKKSPAYSYYKSIGISVFDLKTINNKSLNIKLSESQMDQNRKILMEKYSLNAVQNKVNELIDVVLSSSK